MSVGSFFCPQVTEDVRLTIHRNTHRANNKVEFQLSLNVTASGYCKLNHKKYLSCVSASRYVASALCEHRTRELVTWRERPANPASSKDVAVCPSTD